MASASIPRPIRSSDRNMSTASAREIMFSYQFTARIRARRLARVRLYIRTFRRPNVIRSHIFSRHLGRNLNRRGLLVRGFAGHVPAAAIPFVLRADVFEQAGIRKAAGVEVQSDGLTVRRGVGYYFLDLHVAEVGAPHLYIA